MCAHIHDHQIDPSIIKSKKIEKRSIIRRNFLRFNNKIEREKRKSNRNTISLVYTYNVMNKKDLR